MREGNKSAIKNLETVRAFLRSYFVEGLKPKISSETEKKDFRNHRSWVTDWLNGYEKLYPGENGVPKFWSADSRELKENPLFRAFTASVLGDVAPIVHFLILRVLKDGKPHTRQEMINTLNDALPSESSLNNILNSYVTKGILTRGRGGKYALKPPYCATETEIAALEFAAGYMALGVPGYLILRRQQTRLHGFRFRHHYYTNAMDAEVILLLCGYMRTGEAISLSKTGNKAPVVVFPYRIYISVRNGRQYLLCYNCGERRPEFLRLERITASGITGAGGERMNGKIRAELEGFARNSWGVAAKSTGKTQHLEMTVRILPGEDYILRRLMNEKRMGTVTKTGEATYVFSADVQDAYEMIPWIRTFMGRIVSLDSSNSQVLSCFKKDIREMTAMYGEGGQL